MTFPTPEERATNQHCKGEPCATCSYAATKIKEDRREIIEKALPEALAHTNRIMFESDWSEKHPDRDLLPEEVLVRELAKILGVEHE